MNTPTPHRGLDISRAISDGWNALRRSPLEAILGYVIYSQVGGYLILIPFAGPFLFFPFVGGFVALYLNVARRPKGDFEDLLAGFRDFWKWMGLVALLILGYVASIIPAALATLAAVLITECTPHTTGSTTALLIVCLAVGILATLVIYTILSIRWFFVLFVGADGGGILESFEVSVRMARGNYLKLFLVNVLSFIIGGVVTLLTCGLGAYFIGPLIMLICARIYVDLRISPDTA